MARRSSRGPTRHTCSTFEHLLPLLEREHRDRMGLFWAEGCRSLFSAVRHDWPIVCTVSCPPLVRSHHVARELKSLARRGVPSVSLSQDEFSQLSRRLEPDGVGVVCEQRWHPLIGQHPRQGDTWVALDSVRTPGNLGTIFRTCAATGAQGVMLIGGEADPYEPGTIRASMGAIFSVKLVRTSARALTGWKGRRHVQFVGASPSAQTDYRQAQYRTPLVLMMGSERIGLRDRQVALCDQMVRLPMTNEVDSLNVAVATSVLLYASTSAGNWTFVDG
jgi:RNA methyltransferase, TrmH family